MDTKDKRRALYEARAVITLVRAQMDGDSPPDAADFLHRNGVRDLGALWDALDDIDTEFWIDDEWRKERHKDD